MIALWILCGIAILVGLILLTSVGIELRYDGDIRLSIMVAFYRYQLIPERTKKVRLWKFSKKRYERLLAKETAEKKPKKKPQSVHKHDKEPAAPVKREEKSKLASDLWQMRSVILDILGGFFRKVRTRRVKIHLTVGAEDAASCALQYGVASQFAAYALELVRSQTKMECREDVSVSADFTSETTAADIELRFCVRVGSVIASILRLGVEYFKKMIKEN